MKRWIIHWVIILTSASAFAMSSWRPPVTSNTPPPTQSYAFGGTGALPSVWKPYGKAWVRVEEDGNLSCLAFDATHCDTTGLSSIPDNKTAKPLVCGSAHQKIYGVTGYDTAGHWCNSAYASLFARWEKNSAYNIFVSQNPYGDVMCFSYDGINCSSATTPPQTGTLFKPLVCGKIHKTYWGDDGYTKEEHWCNEGLNKFTLAVTSDPQYPWLNEGNIPSSGNEARDSTQSITQTYNSINDFNSRRKVAGVIINGDVTAYGHEDEWKWMNNTLSSLQPPIFLSLGNHDYENNVNNCLGNTCIRNSLDNLENYASKYASSFDRTYVKFAWQKNYFGSFAWSRDIGQIHYVFLNNDPTYSFKAGSIENSFSIQSAIPWLDRDLQRARAAGKVIVLVHHKPFEEFSQSNGFTKDMFEAMVKKYNVSAIFLGHLHKNAGKVGSFGGATTIYSGSASTQTYLLVYFDQIEKVASAYLVKSGDTSANKPKVATFSLKAPKENLPNTPVSQSVYVTFKNLGGYVAKLKVSYPGGSYEKDLNVQEDALFETPVVPVGSVTVTAQAYTGLAWEPLRTIISTAVSDNSICTVVWGTTLNTQWKA
jgi:cytolysin (calcineurin-like family phosphatase)